MDKLKRAFSVFIAIALGSALVLSLAHTHEMTARASGSVPGWYKSPSSASKSSHSKSIVTKSIIAVNLHEQSKD